jgi:hypothetical protein
MARVGVAIIQVTAANTVMVTIQGTSATMAAIISSIDENARQTDRNYIHFVMNGAGAVQRAAVQ